MWGDSESASKNTLISIDRNFPELVYKKFKKIWASDLVKAPIYWWTMSIFRQLATFATSYVSAENFPLSLNRSPKFSKIFCKKVLRISFGRGSTYFCSLIPNHPTWRRVKMLPWEVMGEKLIWSRDQPAKRIFRSWRLVLGLGLGWGSGLGLGWWLKLWLG